MRRTSGASMFMIDEEPNGDTRAFAANASRDGLVKLGWVHCLQYTVNCFQYNVCDLCRCESSNY